MIELNLEQKTNIDIRHGYDGLDLYIEECTENELWIYKCLLNQVGTRPLIQALEKEQIFEILDAHEEILLEYMKCKK